MSRMVEVMGGQLALGLARDKKLTGGEMVSAAYEWTRQHPLEWDAVINMARDHAAHGERFSVRHLCDSVAWVSKVGVPHSITSSLARLLIEEVPEAEPYVKTARSKADSCVG